MRTKRFCNILIDGVLGSWFVGFVVSFLQSVALKDRSITMWFLLIAGSVLLMLRSELNKNWDENKAVWIEQFFLVMNIIIVMVALGGFFITFSDYWFAKELLYTCLALGLPSLVTVIYWFILKRYTLTK